MALLQIAEPGQSSAPHEHKRAVGIDLGTTNTLVGAVRSGVPVTLKDALEQALIPSIVHYGEQVIVGTDAKPFAESDSANTIISVKRMMGRALKDVQSADPHLPYQLESTENGLPLIKTRHGKKNPIQVSAEILTVAKKRAESALGGELDGVVITVPAYFDDAQRAATKEAANLAGLNTLRLLNEPTAAAIAYGLDSGSEGVIAVYDLGGGTFDISILRLSRGVFEVLSTGGDSALGGDDFDHCIAEWILHQLPDQALSADAHRQLHILASKLKIALSEQDDVTFDFMAYQGQISKGVFSELISKLVQKTLMTCKRALRDAKVTTEMVDEIVLVGGSTRVPYVRDQVAQFFKKSPLTSIDPDQVVALGAAIQADILVGNKPEHEVLLLDVIPLSLGIETMGGLVEKIIPRNTTIPVAKAQEFTTFKDGQTGMKVHVVQGEREMVNDCRSLANFSLKGIPPMTAGAAHIRVTYQVDADGLLSVTAMEKSTGVQTAIQVKPSFGLSDTEIADMIRSSFTNAQSDKDARYLAEQRVEADRVIESLLAALQADGDKLLSEEEQQSLIAEIEQLIALRNGNDGSLIEQGIKTLDKASQTFAERRMDFSIRHALTGQSIDEV